MKNGKTVVVIFAAIVIAAIIFNIGPITQNVNNYRIVTPPPGQVTTTTTQSTSSGTVVQTQNAGYQGSVTLNDIITDPLNVSTLTDATNVQVTYYVQNTDGTYRSLGASAANAATITVVPSMQTIYVGIVIPSGQSYYPALDKMGTQFYSRLGTPFWGTPNLSNLYQPVYPLNIQNLNGIGTGLTTPSLQIPISAYTQTTVGNVNINGCTTGASASCGATTYVSNSNKTGVGAGSVTTTEQIPLTFTAGGNGIALYQFSMTLNDTVLSDINTAASTCSFPTGLLGTGPPTTIAWSQATPVYGSTTTKYLFNVAPDLTIRTAPLVEVPKIGNNQVTVTCSIATNFAATNNGATFSPTLTWITMQAGLNSIQQHIFKIVA